MTKPRHEAQDNGGRRQDEAQHTDAQTPAGTEILPMPDVPETVAGMPRDRRNITEPGEPGVITPEDDVLDTSHPGARRR
ncbi:hypothetical protein [Bordetella sp. 2513F-2]